MSRKVLLRTSALGVVALVAAAGCAKTDTAVAGAKKVDVALTSSGCAPSATSVAAGPVTFYISNKSSAATTEAELQQSDATILAEKENVAPGLSGTFSVSLKPGSYKLYCPGGSTDGYTNFTVTGGDAAAAPANPAVTSALATGTAGYATYVRGQVAQLVTTTKTFTDAVRAGDLASAATAYPVARVYYERIEPVAEAFGDLDPDIDNRIDDVAAGAQWTGFHRLEKAIFADKSLTGMTPIATQLDANIAQLNTLVTAKSYQAGEIASGAVELLDEVGKTKITGEEERYSKFDLIDFVANVAGSQQAYNELAPALKIIDPTLATQVSERFAALNKALAVYSTGPAPSDYVTYDKVPLDQHKVLSQLVDAVAEPLAQVGGQVVTG